MYISNNNLLLSVQRRPLPPATLECGAVVSTQRPLSHRTFSPTIWGCGQTLPKMNVLATKSVGGRGSGGGVVSVGGRSSGGGVMCHCMHAWSVVYVCLSVCVSVSCRHLLQSVFPPSCLPQNYTFQAYFKGPGYNSSRPDTSGVCVLSNTGRHDALSPTFSRSADGTWVYDKEKTADYSSWAESR